MRRATLPEKLALAVPLLGAACSSDHHVSPWGDRGTPTLGAYVEAPDLSAQLARVDAETAPLGLSLGREVPFELPRGGGKAMIRAYDGADALGRPVHAVRVATSRAVVMALGPLDAHDLDRDSPTELVPALGGGAFRSGTDFDGDGRIDVVVRAESGSLAIWGVQALGAAPYDVEMKTPALRAVRLGDEGQLALAGEAPLEAGDPLAPELTDVATFDEGRYTDRSEAARAYHARLGEPPPAAPSASGSAPAAPAPAGSTSARVPGPPPPSDATRLRAALERAWHAALSGTKRADVRKELDREAVPAELRAAFDRHARRIAAAAEP